MKKLKNHNVRYVGGHKNHQMVEFLLNLIISMEIGGIIGLIIYVSCVRTVIVYKLHIEERILEAGVAELVDARVLNTLNCLNCAGSIPAPGTKIKVAVCCHRQILYFSPPRGVSPSTSFSPARRSLGTASQFCSAEQNMFRRSQASYV